MRKGTMTREQVIGTVGVDAVERVDAENCEPTNRLGYNGACQDDTATEWSASVKATDADGDDVTLTAYYYTSNEDDQRMADNNGDGSDLDWTVEGYEIV